MDGRQNVYVAFGGRACSIFRSRFSGICIFNSGESQNKKRKKKIHPKVSHVPLPAERNYRKKEMGLYGESLFAVPERSKTDRGKGFDARACGKTGHFQL